MFRGLKSSKHSGSPRLAFACLAVIFLYRLLFLPALVVVLPWFLWRTRGRGDWRQGMRNRCGRFEPLPPKRPGTPRIWLQAVSVGELLAVIPLVEALRHETGAEVFLTTTTTTGLALAKERLRGAVIGPAFFPVDFWPWSARAWRAVAPDLVLLAEGERWPEHLHQAVRRHVPVVCVNARLSERGFRRARRLRGLMLPCWRGISRILAGTVTDTRRFIELGFPADRVQVTGNMKLDVSLPRLSDERRSELRRAVGLGGALVFLGASTWPGEEAALVDVLREARAAGLNVRLLIVPRHVERRSAIAALLASTEFTHHFRSAGVANGEVDVAVVDTTGELQAFLQVADLVFVGRSLAPHLGGQTPLEAAVLEKPVLFGPGMANFRELADGMVAADAAVRVSDATELCRESLRLLREPDARQAIARAAWAWTEVNRGATNRTLTVLKTMLGMRPEA